jgi:hypothetical protein
MPMGTKTYREIHVNLRPKEAFTDSMLGMTGTIKGLGFKPKNAIAVPHSTQGMGVCLLQPSLRC